MDPAAADGVEREWVSVCLDELRYLCACACSTSLHLSGVDGGRTDNTNGLDAALAALRLESGREIGHLAWGYGRSPGEGVEEARLALQDAIGSIAGSSGRVWLQERGHTSHTLELVHEFSCRPRLVRQAVVDEVPPPLVLACAQDALHALNLQRTATNRVARAVVQVSLLQPCVQC